MTLYYNFCLHRRWILLLYFILSGFILFFMLEIKNPTSELLQTVGWYNPRSADLKSVSCLPVENIVFLKTHKSASSSVQNILMRYADEKGLTIALPSSGKTSIFSLMRPFQKSMVTGVPWENLGFNILCHHMIFNYPVIQSLMPKDSVYISIVRDPVSLFESLYEYAGLEEFYKMDIEEYARNTKNLSIQRKLQARSQGMGRNQMLYDFGVHPVYFNNYIKIQKAIDDLDSYFDFVMIAEYFDMSIVILSHILCWELDDVISLTINARMDTYKKILSTEAAVNLRHWNWGDQMLYNYFLQKFNQTINDIGRTQLDFEVKELTKKRGDWLDYCIEKKVEAKNLTAYKIWSSKVSAYKIKSSINNRTCENLVKPERYFTSEIRQKQLIKSIMNGARVVNYGPKSFSHLLDIKYLKGPDYQLARQLIENTYKNKRKLFPSKEKRF